MAKKGKDLQVTKDIFVSPLFDLTPLTNFADDNFCIESGASLEVLIANLEMRLEMITKWLREYGLVVNESKPSCVYFISMTNPSLRSESAIMLLNRKSL